MQVDSDDDDDLQLISVSTSSTSTSKPNKDNPRLAVLVFVHGFKGDDKTFGDYPSRLQHSIATTLGPESDVHAWVYPAFETRGELSQCVHGFGEWLTTKIAELEMETAAKHPQGKKELARVVLIGHSMGGIVVADFARSVARRREDSVPKKPDEIWPKIVGVLAYDTPCERSLPCLFGRLRLTFNHYRPRSTPRHIQKLSYRCMGLRAASASRSFFRRGRLGIPTKRIRK